MKFENKGLVVLLGVLGIVIIGLVVGIVVVNMNGGDEIVTSKEDEDEISYQEYTNYVEEYDAVRAEAQRLLGENPVDVDAIIKLYSKYIDANLANDELDRASSYIYAENEDLLAGGFKQEALDAMLVIDYSVFDEPEQYRWYVKIIDLANELGESNIAKEYEPLAASTKAAYDANYAAAEAAAKEFDLPLDGEEEAE